jgi:hypothetical protein
MLIDALKRAKSRVVLAAADERLGLSASQIEWQFAFFREVGRPAGYANIATQRDWVVRCEALPAAGGAFPMSFAELLADTQLHQKPENRWRRIVWLEEPPDGSDPMLMIPAETLLGAPDDPLVQRARSGLNDKIVILGALLPDIDQHLTPLTASTSEPVAGAVIHAHIVAQHVDGVFLYRIYGTLQYLISVTLCLAAFVLGWTCARRIGYLLVVLPLMFLSLGVDFILFKLNLESSVLFLPIWVLSLLAGVIYGRLRVTRLSRAL